ncbi:MAG: NFACT family protein [Thaumarchaeota archaeon]|nr:NFACT family protein [Nitrososphaerota archaeon]
MELADIELKRILKDLEDKLRNYYVNNVYFVDADTVLLRLWHPVNPAEKLAISAGRGIWLTRFELEQEDQTVFLRSLRKGITRLRIERFEQPKGERIAKIILSGDQTMILIGEFFGEGNIVLTDGSQQIIALLHTLKVRHRKLVPGVTYTLPPSRSLFVEDLTLKDLTALQASNLQVARWLGRNLSLPRKYVHEIILRSAIPMEAIGQQLSGDQISKLYTSTQQVLELASTPSSTPILILDNGNTVGFAPFPLLEVRETNSKQVASLLEALDQAFTQEVLHLRNTKGNEQLSRRLEELKHSGEAQVKSREELLQKAKALRAFASKLMGLAFSRAGASLTELIGEAFDSAIEFREVGGGKSRVFGLGFQLEVESGLSPQRLASMAFDEAKRFEEKAITVESAQKDLLRQIEELQAKISAKTESSSEPLVIPPRAKHWFERYRWFKTSEGLLAVGGRDAASNSAVIRKHLESLDIVFHTDIVGSPFFVLKGGSNAISQSIQETAQATASFSRAWSSGFSSADAYWVNSGQVKLAAPSGQYLPKGSFPIEGEKHFLKGIPIAVAIGFTFLDEQPVIFGGAPSAVEQWSSAYVVLAADRVKATDTAKHIKSQLISLADSEETKLLKKVPIDDFLRAMPPGGGRIIQKGSGKQKH